MAAGFYISRALALALALVSVGALASIIALSVLYAKEKTKDLEPSPTSPAAATTTADSSFPSPSSSPGPPVPWQQYRLPDTLAPVHYAITLWPRLEPDGRGLFIFTGNSTVRFVCLKDTDLILIHSNRLNFTLLQGHEAQLMALGATAPAIKTTWLELTTDYLVVQLEGRLEAGRSYLLHTEFVGELADDLAGFYRSKYKENGVEKILATTQMQPTDARKAFPCFDEPAMKAVFDLTMIHPLETVALSNSINYGSCSPLTKPHVNLTMTRFHSTEMMSTYLLAFVVCELGFISSAPGAPVLIRIWARKQAILEGQGDYALEKTGPILSYFQNYYNQTYPLTKSDQIALPDFSAGAMENWGLITYRESALLYNPAFSSIEDKEYVATVISHELAHMWFGNLVTMRWWNDLWLNEGFATYVSYLGADSAEPTWKLNDLMVVFEIHGVMQEDDVPTSHPLSCEEGEVQKPQQIRHLFDTITYSKGAAVLRMLSDSITEEVFTQGLRTYLEEHKYNSTICTDLWKHLQVAVDEASPGLGLPTSVEDIMNRWVLQMGYPVVTVDTRTGRLSQKHFLIDPEAEMDRPSPFNYEWIVPISWMKTGVKQSPLWLTTKEATNSNMTIGGADWLLVNLRTSGFYRVNYDQENWERLLAQLDTNHQEIPEINRAQLISDAFNLARSKLVNFTLALRTTKYLVRETEYTPWLTVSNNLNYYFLMFDRSPLYGPMQAYMVKQVEPLFNHFKDITANWTKIPDKHTDQYNQVVAIQLACKNGLKACEDLTYNLFNAWMKNPSNNPISPNLRSTVYCNGLAAGGQREWDFAWSMYKNASVASEAEKLLWAMACSKQPWILTRYLEYCLDSERIRKQDASYVINSIAANVVGQPLVWDFVRANWNYLFNDYGNGSISFESLLYSVTRRFASEFEYKELLRFEKVVESNPRFPDFHQALERTRVNIKWVSSHKDQILSWFTEEAKPKPQP
uniref:Aminopeptidase n=1 Tax=Gadus morhua TaxID=8049 RepID=A0A8C5CU20_GADMO